MNTFTSENKKIKNSFEKLIANLSQLPSIGNKTAERLAAYIVKADAVFVKELSESILTAKENIKFCSICGAYAESDICRFCSDTERDQGIICVLEEPLDIWPIERTCGFKGVYHILMGIISIHKGISPSDLNINTLINRIKNGKIKEVIFAMNPTLDGDSTAFFLKMKISRLAMGLPAGSMLEYADRETLGRAIANRTQC